MKGTRKDRRSRRIPATHRLLLTILSPAGSEIAKEIVSTVELSQYGARVRGRQVHHPGAEGVLTQLSSGRQARVRIAWQKQSADSAGFLDTGVELLSSFDYWGISFAEPPPLNRSNNSAEATALSTAEILRELKTVAAGGSGAPLLETLWCGLIEQLEARNLISRKELAAALRGIAQSGSRPPSLR